MDKFYYDSDIFRIKNWEQIDSLKAPHSYSKNQIIYLQGDDANYLYYLKSGKIEIYFTSPGGSEKILTTFSNGSIFGKASFFDKVPRTSSARTIEKSEIIAIDRSMFMSIIKIYPEFVMDMLGYLSKTIRMLSDQVQIMTFDQADKRVAQYIINAHRYSSTKPAIMCTHEEICERIGASRVTVSKILSRFCSYGWIETKYRQIFVTNIDALVQFELENN